MTLPLTGAGPSAPGFDPLSLSPSLWLKADAITGKNDGDALAQWDDSSGNANHATQGTAASRPLYKTNIVNGKPVVRFDVTDDGMGTPVGAVAGTSFTLFCVYDFRGATPAVRRAVHATGANWLIGPYNGNHQFYDGGGFTAPDGPAVTQNVFVYQTAKQTASTSVNYVNGTQYGTRAQAGSPGITAFNLGSLGSDVFDGDMAELLIYPTALSDVNRQSVETYLAAKYAL